MDAAKREHGHNNKSLIFLVVFALGSAASSKPLPYKCWNAVCPKGSWEEDEFTLMVVGGVLLLNYYAAGKNDVLSSSPTVFLVLRTRFCKSKQNRMKH
jgi:hypothetical protein